MEMIIDMMSVRPGERFKFRMIGKPKTWYRVFLDDGSYVDVESKVDIPSTQVFASFVKDRATDALCVIVMPSDMAGLLANKFRMLGVLPGAEHGVDVDISIMSGAYRYFIDVGKCSTLTKFC